MGNLFGCKFTVLFTSVVLLLLITINGFAGQTSAATEHDPIEGKWYGVSGFSQDRVELYKSQSSCWVVQVHLALLDLVNQWWG